MQHIAKREKVAENKKSNNENQETKKKYIPPVNHPWRKDMKKFFIKT